MRDDSSQDRTGRARDEAPAAWRAAWEELELPAADDPGPAFTTRVLARARETRRAGVETLPGWARAAAVLALAAGLAGGWWLSGGAGWSSAAAGDEALLAWDGDSLAEEYVALGEEP